jgi:hypothetical protein
MTAPRMRFPIIVTLYALVALVALAAWLTALLIPVSAFAEVNLPGPPLTIHRLSAPITLDGNLDDAGWKDVTPVTQWFETNATDNTEPQVKNVGWLAYDDHYLYAAFRFDDPDPSKLRAPLGDHDNLSGYTDYGGVIVDSRNDGHTAQLFLANANGLQYDALSSDVSGEDNSPDYFWDAAGRVTATGWTLELRIPFSSLRYADPKSPRFGIMLYRNYPRDRHYQFFSNRLPKDVNCFICNESPLTGLENLPKGSHLVLAPYATAARTDEAAGGPGTPLSNGTTDTDAGLDVKWSPLANTAVDATFNPDFSQVEADAAQIGANERFALFYPEKRSFFLEGVDLLSMPLQAVYTRTITSPSMGLRVTGRAGTTAYTALVAHDRGGGLGILPGPEGSDFALQDFRSDVAVMRLRKESGQSFVSLMGTTREIDGGGYNRVAGPDFRWGLRPTDTITGQLLWSASHTPNRPDLAGEWDGRSLNDRAMLLSYWHADAHFDFFAQGQDLGPGFRADDGFIPQVGYREALVQTGWTERPKDRFLSRVRTFAQALVDMLPDGSNSVLAQQLMLGAGMDGKLASFLRLELNEDAFRVGPELLRRFRPRVQVQASPGRVVNSVTLDSYFGEEIDFANGREGHGATVTATATFRPTNHLELAARTGGRWLNVDAGSGRSGRLFHAEVDRLRATYMFNSRAFVRLIGQYQATHRDPSLYTFGVPERDALWSTSGLFAYKLNWQTVLYAGYGDDRSFTDVTGHIEPVARQAFAKVSYAWQQ